MAMPYEYTVYGVTLTSDMPLPLASTGKAGLATVTLTTARQEYFELQVGAARHDPNWDSWFQYAALPDGRSYVRGWEMGEVLVSADGRQITCHADSTAAPESFQVYLLGQALSFALLKLGFEPLHGTAVVVQRKAVVLLGDSGSGKSTLAAAFVEAGHPVLTDDVLVTHRMDGAVMAFPGPARLKLFPRVAGRFAGDLSGAVRMNNDTPKLVIPLGPASVCAEPVPVAAFYELVPPSGAPGPQPVRIGETTRRDAALVLVRSAFNQRFVNRSRLERQFHASAGLAEHIPLRQLSYPRLLSRLPDVVSAVVADMVCERVIA
jgi:energy-coupling factor transporter ATP-binding protein EcfA2